MNRSPYLLALGPLLVTTACTLGPDPTIRPVTAADGAAAFVNPAPADPPVVDRWWESLADPITVELVDLALAANSDLRAAAARVLEARSVLTGARGARWPQVDFSLAGNRGKSSFVMPGVGRVGVYSTTFADDLTISYQVDLFGRLARTRQAAWADLLANEANHQAVLHTVVAEVVLSRVRIATLVRQLELARATAASWQETTDLVADRYSFGLAPAEDLHLTRQSLAAAEAAIPGLELALATSHHALDVLTGRRPGSGPDLPATLPPVPDPQPIPVGLPVDLLDRRPDLVAARMRLAANTAAVGVALAKLYPSLSLTASGGTKSDDLGSLLSSEGLVHSAVASVLAPLFNGGQRRAEVAGARARTERAAAEYAQAVLKALAEVEGGLASEAALRRQHQARLVQFDSASAAAELVGQRYHSGTGSMLELLVADRTRSTAENALIVARSALWEARIALYLALGGDWQEDSSGEIS